MKNRLQKVGRIEKENTCLQVNNKRPKKEGSSLILGNFLTKKGRRESISGIREEIQRLKAEHSQRGISVTFWPKKGVRI